MSCPLCLHDNCDEFDIAFGRSFHKCSRCSLVFVDRLQLPEPSKERERYRKHENSPDDPRYLEYIEQKLSALNLSSYCDARALDFGCGPESVLSTILERKGVQSYAYDPVFKPNPEALAMQFDLIVCIEVVEHFHRPRESFLQLDSLLANPGTLFISTNLYSDSIDFTSWWYVRDFTHVAFYQQETFEWISTEWSLDIETLTDELVVFSRS